MDLIGRLGELEEQRGFRLDRGIALTRDIIYLFNLIEENKKDEVCAFLEGLLQGNAMSEEMEAKMLTTTQKIQKVLEEKLNLSDPKAFFEFLNTCNLMQVRAHMDTRESLENYFKNSNIQVESRYIDAIIDMKKYILYHENGILSFCIDENGQTVNPKSSDVGIDREKTYQKVKALYDYITGKLIDGQNRFNTLTLDGQGKFGTVAGVIKTSQEKEDAEQGEITFENYNFEPLRQGYEFAKKHGMDVRINALVFFKDFPDRLVGASKEEMKTALINYGKAVALLVNEYKTSADETPGVVTTVDMFNEFVDYYEPFSIRTNNWMSQLSIEDLCEVALELKKEMPNVDFGYNDWNFENEDKRKSIFEVLKRIQDFEKANNCRIINHIGTQCHTSINDIEGLEESLKDLANLSAVAGLPIDVTELDISRKLDGVDYGQATPEELAAIKKYEQKLQNDVMKLLSQAVQDGIIRSITEWSITDEICCDFCDGKKASVTGMSYDSENGFSFYGKDMDKEIVMTQEEMDLIEEHKKKVRESAEQEINQNPIQDFCFHTHTSRCGHGAKDTGDEEWVQNAIKGGMKKIAFTDHIPMPQGLNKIAKSRMDIAEEDSYLESIDYLQKKEKYKDKIEIESGYEFEYAESYKGVDYLEFLKERKSKVDKMILGQHWVIDENGRQIEIERGEHKEQITDSTLQLYEESILNAMDQGLPDVIAHPDLFMQARDSFGEKEEKVAREICRKASEKGIPLEINFGKIASKVESKMSMDEIKSKIPYPSPKFWEIVAEETKNAQSKGKDLLVIYGKDAHYPEQLSTEKDYEIAKEIIGEETLAKLHIVTKVEELEKLQTEIRRKQNAEAVSYFHDQKSEFAMEQINSGKKSLGFSDSMIPKKTETPIFSEREIGKATVHTPVEQKQEAESVGESDMREVEQLQVDDKNSNNFFPEGHDE